MSSMPPAWRRVARWISGLTARFAGADDGSPRPFIRRSWRHLSLQFSDTDAQSRMLRRRPDALLVDYTRTMLAALLITPQPRRIGMIGLGGGSQAKFCHRHFPNARVEVVEIDPRVIALRRRFRIPADDERLQVLLGDGAGFVAARRGAFDLLLVDGYDAHGIAPALSTQAFYDDCRAALAEGGTMAVNLYGSDPDPHIERIRRAFGAGRTLVVRELRMSNRVVFGWVGGPAPEALTRLHTRIPDWLDADARRQLAGAFAEVARQAAQRFAAPTGHRDADHRQ